MEITQKVIEWANDKGILEKSKPLKQHVKTQEEVNELLDAIINDDLEEIKDAIGDIAITLIIQAEMNGLNFIDCINSAYDVIKDRKGKMVNGIFIKNK